MISHVVEISDVFPDAYKIKASEFRVGHYVHTPTGRRIRLVKVRHFKHVVRVEREDGAVESFDRTETYTVADNPHPEGQR